MTPEQRKHFEFVRDEMHGEPKQEQGEPVAESVEKLKELGWNDAAIDKANTPQQRTWVGLTDEQIKHIYISTTGWSISDSDPMLVDFARAIEAKLKEKNT